MYTTGKYAVVGLSESLRHHLAAAGAPIGVSVLCPGAVATDITATGRDAIAEVDPENSSPAIEFADRFIGPATDLLARYGQDPDVVGAMVVNAIYADRPFILTDRAADLTAFGEVGLEHLSDPGEPSSVTPSIVQPDIRYLLAFPTPDQPAGHLTNERTADIGRAADVGRVACE